MAQVSHQGHDTEIARQGVLHRHLTPGGDPSTSTQYNNHGISEILGHSAFRTINDTRIEQTCGKHLPGKIRIINKIVLVEAAGVEPASEIAVSQESPCCVRFLLIHSGRSERTRCDRS